MKAIRPVTSMCLLTKPFIGKPKAWKIMTLLSLRCLDEMVALWSGNSMALFHKSTIWKPANELPNPPKACEGEEGRSCPSGAGRAQHSLLLQSLCPTGQSSVLLRDSFNMDCNGTCLSSTDTDSALFRNYGRAENCQHLSSFAFPRTAKVIRGSSECKQLCLDCILLEQWLRDSFWKSAGAPCHFQIYNSHRRDSSQQV